MRRRQRSTQRRESEEIIEIFYGINPVTFKIGASLSFGTESLLGAGMPVIRVLVLGL
jgi:hypothetical protein